MSASTILATIAALSVAVERVVEILKQMFGSWPVLRLLFTPCKTQSRENVRCACLYLLSGTVGGVIAGVSDIQIPQNARHPYFSYAIVGLLSSGGSAFWNHALDLMQAAKVQKEVDARDAVQASLVTTAGANAGAQ